MISYAQNFEDAMIARLFPQGHNGFYIDIGAADPVKLSVTKHFYDAGWSGINVEPLPRFFRRLQAERPRDVNLQVVVGSAAGESEFFEILDLPENSTSNLEVMAALRAEGSQMAVHHVRKLSLRDICEEYAGDRQIDFMKIDVEGGELDILANADWVRFRPILLVVEAVVVNGQDEAWSEWEPVITANRYEKVWFDGLNNFYLRQESSHLKERFQLAPNLWDNIVTARLIPQGDGWIDQGDLLALVDADRHAKEEARQRVGRELEAVEQDRQAKQEIVDRLIAEVEAINLDRQAKQSLVDRLDAELHAVRADQQAKQLVIDALLSEGAKPR